MHAVSRPFGYSISTGEHTNENELFENCAEVTQLVGHSMGGSVLVRACPMLLSKKYRITGVAVLDVVEGDG